jgi:hypothetical protein
MVMKYRYDPKTAASITALAQRIMDNNLCKEIMLSTQSQPCVLGMSQFVSKKYQFSRNWYEVKLFFKSYDPIQERIDWCEQTFGPQPKNPDAWARWYTSFTTLRFRDEKDYHWFILKWGQCGQYI